jgi:O-antigen/teichoic acid export membrane protein
MEYMKPLFSIGGWLTVSNVVSPLMNYVDRFIIGALVSASAVAYYATPYELVTKLWIVPGALTAVLFPTFAAQIAANRRDGVDLFRQSISILFLALAPACTALALFAHEILTIWINTEFAANSATLLVIFSIGVLINGLTTIPFTLIQSASKVKVTALAHLFEAPAYFVVLYWLTLNYGTIGASAAWLLRIVFDAAIMFIIAIRITGLTLRATTYLKYALIATIVLMIFFASTVELESLAFRIFLQAIVCFYALFHITRVDQVRRRFRFRT